MANTAVPITQLALGSNADVAGTTIVAANTHVITPTKGTRKLLLRFKNTTASTKVWTVVAGDTNPAQSAGQGDTTVSLTDGSTTPTYAYIAVEAARHMQDDGTILVTVASATTGTVTAFQMP